MMAELQAGEGKEEKGKKKEEGGNDGEEGEGVRRLPQRTNSQRAEREEERRSRRALFQSVSTSNLNQQPSSSLPPPPLPRFHLGDLDQSALPPKLFAWLCWLWMARRRRATLWGRFQAKLAGTILTFRRFQRAHFRAKT